MSVALQKIETSDIYCQILFYFIFSGTSLYGVKIQTWNVNNGVIAIATLFVLIRILHLASGIFMLKGQKSTIFVKMFLATFSLVCLIVRLLWGFISTAVVLNNH
jgi:hypothetical protein